MRNFRCLALSCLLLSAILPGCTGKKSTTEKEADADVPGQSPQSSDGIPADKIPKDLPKLPDNQPDQGSGRSAKDIIAADSYTSYNVGPGVFAGCLAFGAAEIKANPDFDPAKFKTNRHGKCPTAQRVKDADGKAKFFEIVAYCDVKPSMRYYFYDQRANRARQDAALKAICDHNKIPGDFVLVSR